MAVGIAALVLLLPAPGHGSARDEVTITISGTNPVVAGSGQTCVTVNISGSTPPKNPPFSVSLQFSPATYAGSVTAPFTPSGSMIAAKYCYTVPLLSAPLTIDITATNVAYSTEVGTTPITPPPFTSNTFDQTWNPNPTVSPVLEANAATQKLGVGQAAGVELASTPPGTPNSDVTTWSNITVSGNLPTGLSYNASTGWVYGTPTKAGIFTFSVSVAGDPSVHTYTWTVAPRPASASSPAAMTAVAVKPVALGGAAPVAAVSLNLSKPVKLKLTLRDAKGRVVARWTKSAMTGRQTLKLALPKQARHQGRDTLQVTSVVADAVNSKTVPVVLRAG